MFILRGWIALPHLRNPFSGQINRQKVLFPESKGRTTRNAIPAATKIPIWINFKFDGARKEGVILSGQAQRQKTAVPALSVTSIENSSIAAGSSEQVLSMPCRLRRCFFVAEEKHSSIPPNQQIQEHQRRPAKKGRAIQRIAGRKKAQFLQFEARSRTLAGKVQEIAIGQAGPG